MKFSYSLIKNLVPKLRSKSELAEALNMRAFEVEGVSGDTLEINIQPNRYSDAASHLGIAREAAAILNLKLQIPKISSQMELKQKPENFDVLVRDKDLCPRYTAQYFENVGIKSSPDWMQKILKDCGLRPINNVVDTMNYVMLEVGQPLHAFDADKIKGSRIIIRKARAGESIISIDGEHYKLEPDTLVIADSDPPAGGPQAIAGIKGGKTAEVSAATKRIIVESANFDPVSIYKTSKKLNLVTDASIRFSHGLSPELAIYGLNRTAELLREVVGAEPREIFDSLVKPQPRRVLKFNLQKFNDFIGSELTQKQVDGFLVRLGFKSAGKDLWEIPDFRTDIQNHEDLAEEVVRLFGHDVLKPKPPQVAIRPSETDELISFSDKVKKILTGLGLDEIYTRSFISREDADNFGFGARVQELENPVSSEFMFLRPSLTPNLFKAVQSNARYLNEVNIFEVGKVFYKDGSKVAEKLFLGVILASREGKNFFELKGLGDELLTGLGLVDYAMVEPGKSDWAKSFTAGYLKDDSCLKIESDSVLFGYLGEFEHDFKDWHISVLEMALSDLLPLVRGEEEYEPIPKYPSVMRDVSLLIDSSVRIGDVIQAIQLSNQKLIYDVDLIDEYADEKWGNLGSVTLRIVFQAEDRTLRREEVDEEMGEIISLLQKRFKARVR